MRPLRVLSWLVRPLLVAPLLLSTHSFATDKPSSSYTLESLIAQPTAWRSFDWTKASQSNVFSDLRWAKNPEQVIEKNGTLVSHERKLNAMGATWEARRWRAGSPEGDVQVTMTRDIPAEQCAQAALAIGQGLGTPIVSDASTRDYFGKDIYFELTWLDWQWTVGQTRVGARCHGAFESSQSRREPNVLDVYYAPVSRTPAIKPSFLLRCTRESESGGSWNALDDLVISVSQTPAMVRNRRMIVFEHEPANVDEVLISFTLKTTQDLIVRYVIDRVTGSLRAEAKALNDKVVGTIRGKCVRAESATLF